MTDTIRGRVVELAAEAPNAVALLAVGKQPGTYVTLLEQIDRTACWLAGRRIGHADRVAVVMPNGPAAASLFLGVSSVATCAPLNLAYKAQELEFYLSDLKPRLVIVDNASESAVREVAARMLIEVVELYDDPAGAAGSFRLGTPNEETAPVMIDYAGAHQVALVLHTSGTTSRPKVVPLTQQNLCVSAANIAASLGLSATDRCLNIMPLFHIHGLVAAVLASLAAGASVVCTPGFDVTSFFDWLAEFQPTWYTGVPTMHHGIVTRAARRPELTATHRLRFIRSSSSALAPTLMARVEETFGVPMLEAYGMTEASHQMTSNGLPPRPRKPGSVGRPTGVQVAIMDDAGELLPPGLQGEVVIRGGNVMLGYDRNPEANARSFTRGWFRTGDNGRFDADGDLFLTGRIKELIVRGGEKIPPREIDEALLAHPAVEQALGFSVPDIALGERVAAVVVLKPGVAPTELELREHAATLLADFKVPDQILFLPEIPKGTTGKPQRIGLAGRLGLPAPSETAPPAEYTAPRNGLERKLAELFAAILRLDRVGIHDNFFAAGGDSILAARLLVRLRQAGGANLTLVRLFQSPTVAELAAIIAADPAQPSAETKLAPVSQDAPQLVTAAQRRMWLMAQLAPESVAYHCPILVRLVGPLDLERLRQSLGSVIERHTILRTGYEERGGMVAAVVHPPPPLALPLADLPNQGAAADWVQRETARSFHLAAGDVLHAAVARLGAEEHLLLLTLHHIACDGPTEPLLLDALARAYNGHLAAEPAAAEPAAAEPANVESIAQYADYAAWQHPREVAAAANQADWWRQRLAGMEDATGIAGDLPRPPLDRHLGKTLQSHLSAATIARARSLAAASNTTLFAVLLAAFKVLVRHYRRDDDIVVATPVSLRNHPAAESMPGLFVNTLILRTSCVGDPTFADFLLRVRGTVLEALAHQETPFDAVVDALRSASSPHVQILFEFRTEAEAAPAFQSLAAQRLSAEAGGAKFDLALNLQPEAGGFRIRLTYHVDSFSDMMVQRFLQGFQRVLEQALEAPKTALSAMNLMTPEENTRMLEFGAQSTTYAPGDCLHTRFEAQAQRTPEAAALTCDGRSLTYRQLNERANQVAAALRRAGVAPEMPVGLFVERSLDLVVGLLGILKAGAAYLPIDPIYPRDRIAFMLRDAEVDFVLTQQSLRDALGETSASVFSLDADRAHFDRESAANLEPINAPHDLAYVIYTSGSTGQPKGCQLTHYNAIRLFQALEAEVRPAATDVWTLFHSHAFDVSVAEIWGALLYGGRLVVVPHAVSRDPRLFHALLVEQRVTVLCQTPSAFRPLMEADLASVGEPLALRLSLRLVLFAGEALDPSSLRPWYERHGDRQPQLVNLFGPTETTVYATWRPMSLADSQAGTGSLIGKPLADLSLYVLDPQLRPVPVGVPGEICIGGAGVARGYLNRPELTRERFLNDPFSSRTGERIYRTGDLARWLPDGDLEYLGRMDRQVKIRGFRVELGEIEAALRRHPAVRDAIVDLHKTDAGTRLVAFVVAAADMPSAAALRAFLSARLPDYMLPAQFVPLASVPLNASGKADRKALVVPAFQVATESSVAPRTPLETELALVWQECLGIARVGVEDNFFAIGGNSLIATRVVVRLQHAFGIDVPVACVFQNPTIASLALAVEELRLSAHSDEELLRMLAEIEQETGAPPLDHGAPRR